MSLRLVHLLLLTSSPLGAAGQGTCSPLHDSDSAGCLPAADPNMPLSTFAQYISTCDQYGIKPSADVMLRLQLGSGTVAVEPSADESFGDLDFRALVKLLEQQEGALLGQVRSLDLSKADLGTTSTLLVARLLRHPRNCIEALDLSYQEVGLEGVCAVAAAAAKSQSLRVLKLNDCVIDDRAGEALVEFLANSTATALREIHIKDNWLEFDVCMALKRVGEEKGIAMYLTGNRLEDQLWCAITHGLGTLLSIIGSILLWYKVYDKPAYYKCPVFLYAMSLLVMYTCSTLFHSFYAMGQTTEDIFGILDHWGVFLVIAGTYSPFFGILFYGHGLARCHMITTWVLVLGGIWLVLTYDGPFLNHLLVAICLGMGWIGVFYIPRMSREIGSDGSWLLLGGGVAYTFGVPWFMHDGHVFPQVPDHAIWHCFVILGSVLHYLCIFMYVVGRPVPEEHADASYCLGGTEYYSDSESERSSQPALPLPDLSRTRARSRSGASGKRSMILVNLQE